MKVVLSLAVLLFTHDAVCGEKEAGTLRLTGSFSLPRSSLALGKLAGVTIAVLIPYTFAFLLASAVLALSQGMDLRADDWLRMGVLMVVFFLYLMVFAAFGLWISTLTHRRMAAFLGLLVLWTVWTLVVPNTAVRVARWLAPVDSLYDVERRADALRWEIRGGRQSEVLDQWQSQAFQNWGALTESQRQQFRSRVRRIQEKWDDEFYPRLAAIQSERRNQMRRQSSLARLLSMVSPTGAVSFLAMDLARTGFARLEGVEDALQAHLVYLAGFIREREPHRWEDPVLTDFVPFEYRDAESGGECLARNAFSLLNLVLLVFVGFAGAYVAMLRYDVR